MVSSKLLHRLATRPADLARYQATGALPRGTTPKSPLITLLKALSPRDLAQLRGLTVNERLGYGCSRTFQFGSQALRWAAPSDEEFSQWPAESWRNKRFAQKLYLEDVLQNCASYPSELLAKYPQLQRPAHP